VKRSRALGIRKIRGKRARRKYSGGRRKIRVDRGE
jgi:hypothetical protein